MNLPGAIYSLVLGMGILYAVAAFALGGLCRGLPRICPLTESGRPARLVRLNPLTLATALIAFGAIGLSLHTLGLGTAQTFLIAAGGAGLLGQLGYVLAAQGFAHRYGSRSERALELPGRHAEVTEAIEPGGTGKISIVLRDAETSFPARASDPRERLPRGAIVMVRDVEDGTAYVKLVE